ncbi:hypothetical protein HK099_001940 [Clydaea vesicula]|uniref:ABC transporter domain-containing protein n=1 Tax=Clydaea vesicula TaxID=447962 RepID=A0AAD5U4P5_9FUNG|nr:hypothetical protein HK099_001940 [Clydaea vesicula]
MMITYFGPLVTLFILQNFILSQIISNSTDVVSPTLNENNATIAVPTIPQTCPVCPNLFSCTDDLKCNAFGHCSGNKCTCQPGWTGEACLQLSCGSPNSEPHQRKAREGNSCEGQCEPGFVGENCNVCTQDDVCKAGAFGSKQICNKQTVVWKDSANMYCEIDEITLNGFFPGKKNSYFARNITDGSTRASLFYDGVEQFNCRTSGCTQELDFEGKVTWKCEKSECRCIEGSEMCTGAGGILGKIFKNLEDSGASIAFPTEESADIVAKKNPAIFFLTHPDFVALLPNGVKLGPCRVGECVDPADRIYLDKSKKPSEFTTQAIASISFGCAVFLLCIIGFAFAFKKQHKLRKIPVPATRTGVSLSFNNISYSVNEKDILQGISGMASSGRLMAILGPSGAGKSTFLDILAGKNKSGTISGDILVNGKTMPANKLRSICGFVDQEDILISTLTVKETLQFSANLRLPEAYTKAEKEKIVDETLETLGLSHIANSYIGGNGVRGISGGEKRRVSIGVELVTSPSILFLDEPTSGLDSYNAMMVIKTLHDLANANGGKTIIFTIHQPRSDVYKLFDDVLILAKGSVMYIGEGKEAASSVAASGAPCPSDYNIADHLLDLAMAHSLADQPIGGVGIAMEPYVNVGGLYNRKKKSIENITDISFDSNPTSMDLHNNKHAGEHFTVSFLTQFQQLSIRSARVLYRQKTLLLAHVGVALLLGIIIGGFYFRITNTFAGFQNHLGSALIILALIGFSSISAIGVFTTERLIFLRERSNGFYGAFPFFLTKIIFDVVPLRILPAIVMGTVSFYMIQLNGDYFKFILPLILFSAQCGMYSLALASAIKDFGTATLVTSILQLFQMLMAGFLINACKKSIILQ